jgi:Arc/MetJ-type ribon-helix-helix transcriptional regulator
MNFESMPVELQQLVAAAMKEGGYASPADAMLAGMRLLREKRKEYEQLKADIQHAIDQADRGEYIEFDREGLREFFEGLKQRAIRANQEAVVK